MANNLTKLNWEILGSREGVDILTISELDFDFYKSIREFTGKNNELLFTYFYNKSFVHYIGTDKYLLGKKVFEKYFNTPKKIKKYCNFGEKLLKNDKKYLNRFKKNFASSISQLRDGYQYFMAAFHKTCLELSTKPFLAIESWQYDLDRIISQLIKRRHLENKREIIISSIYRSWKQTSVAEIREKIRAGVPKKQLVKEYQFLRSWCVIYYHPIDESWLLGIVNADNKTFEKVLSQNEIQALLKPNKKELEAIKLAPYVVFLKEWRDDLRRKWVYDWSFLFEKIALYFKIPYFDLGYLTTNELEAALENNKIDLFLIKQRKSFPCIITLDDKSSSLQMKVICKDIEKYAEIIKTVDKKTKKQITGFPAQTGMAKGKVKVIRAYDDIKKVKIDDILVAVTTHPNYLPAMEKATAIVTDEGGILSHAAIVARELKKPCVIGTKIATKVLKDGDLVEVDAEKGVVRQLTKSKKEV